MAPHPAPPAVFTLEQIWRYPVKSLRGELLERSDADERGLLGDRLWAVRDLATGKLGSGKNTRRFARFPGPALLTLSARYPRPPTTGHPEAPLVTDGEGREYPVADGSADRYFRHVCGVPTLAVLPEGDVGHFDETPVSLIGTATLRWARDQVGGLAVDARRFRPNLVVRTVRPFAEEALLDRAVRIGTGPHAVEVRFDRVLQRCVMVCAPQADLPAAPGMLRMLALRPDHALRVAVAGQVTAPGVIRVGDPIATL